MCLQSGFLVFVTSLIGYVSRSFRFLVHFLMRCYSEYQGNTTFDNMGYPNQQLTVIHICGDRVALSLVLCVMFCRS